MQQLAQSDWSSDAVQDYPRLFSISPYQGPVDDCKCFTVKFIHKPCLFSADDLSRTVDPVFTRFVKFHSSYSEAVEH